MMVTSAISSAISSLKREEGQDLIEYALFGGLIALGIIAVGAAAYTGIVNSLTAGIKHCIDFDATTPCTPF